MEPYERKPVFLNHSLSALEGVSPLIQCKHGCRNGRFAAALLAAAVHAVRIVIIMAGLSFGFTWNLSISYHLGSACLITRACWMECLCLQ